jgi:hypothetical protein
MSEIAQRTVKITGKKGSKMANGVKNARNVTKTRVAKISKIVRKSLIYFKNISKVLKMCQKLIYF